MEDRSGAQAKDEVSRKGIVKATLTILFISILFIGCLASTRPQKSLSELDGFRGIKWGTEISSLKGMEQFEQDKSDKDLVWYTNKGDSLEVSNPTVENISYAFWMGSFEKVWIEFKADGNPETLKKEVFEILGKTPESEELMKNRSNRSSKLELSGAKHTGEYFFREGKKTAMSLSYSADRHKGILEIWSTAISEERRAYEKQKEKDERLKGTP